ncbi:RING-type domain-containing protein [Fusarium sp. LHS14.1]|nr:RING-type domain-containing protein [Fusarium sp. LHS14.1]
MPLPRWFLSPEGMILAPHGLVARAVDDQRHSPDRPPKVTIILAVLVSILILPTPFIIGTKGIARFFSHRDMRDPPERTLCLTPEALNLMPLTKFRGKPDGPKSGGGGGYSPEPPDNLQSCSICTEDFGRGVEFRALPCGHRFHPACIDPWLLQRSLTCPLCRLNVAAGLISTSRPKAPAHPRRVLFLTDLWAHRHSRPRATQQLPPLRAVPSTLSLGPGTAILPRAFRPYQPGLPSISEVSGQMGPAR